MKQLHFVVIWATGRTFCLTAEAGLLQVTDDSLTQHLLGRWFHKSLYSKYPSGQYPSSLRRGHDI